MSCHPAAHWHMWKAYVVTQLTVVLNCSEQCEPKLNFNALSIDRKCRICFANKRKKFFKSKRKQIQLILYLHKAYRHNYGEGAVSSISLKIEAEGQREKQAAFRPAHPSCLCLSCSTAMLRAMFTVIRDGTFLHLARSSLLHLFFCFQAEFPPKLRHFRRPSLSLLPVLHIGGLPPHLETMQRVLYYFRLQTT